MGHVSAVCEVWRRPGKLWEKIVWGEILGLCQNFRGGRLEQVGRVCSRIEEP